MKARPFLGNTLALAALTGLMIVLGLATPADTEGAGWIRSQLHTITGITGLLAFLAPVHPSNKPTQTESFHETN